MSTITAGSQLQSPVRPQTLFDLFLNTGWLFGDRILRMAVGVAVTAALARYLGPKDFGVLNYAIAFVALFGSLAACGLDQTLVRELVRYPNMRDETLGAGFCLRFAASAVSTVLCFGAAVLVNRDSRVAIVTLIVSLTLFFQGFDVFDLYFQSQVQSKFTVIARNSSLLIMAAIRLLLIWRHASLAAFASCNLVESILMAVALWIAFKVTDGRVSQWRYSLARAEKLLADSWPMIVSGMAIMIYMRIDVVMLEKMRGAAAVGTYAAATRLSELWYFIPVAIVSSVSPLIIRSRVNPDLYLSMLQQLFSAMVLISLPIAFVMTAISPFVVVKLFGPSYAAAGPILAVHVWAAVFVFLGTAQLPWDTTENLLKLLLLRTTAGAATNVLLNLVLIPRYAGLGAAIATVLSYALASVFGNALFSRTRKIFAMQLRAFRLAGCLSLLQRINSMPQLGWLRD